MAVKVIEYEVHAGSCCDLSREPLLRCVTAGWAGSQAGRVALVRFCRLAVIAA